MESSLKSVSAAPGMRDRMAAFVHDIQDHICREIAALDGTPFREDVWSREGGGGGRSRVIQEGNVFEKAGVNVSVVHGELSPEAARSMGGGTEEPDLRFFATGVSLVIHPHNPMAPTAHANYRYFERGAGGPGNWWFGGGSDLTPSYLYDDDAAHFHRVHQEALAKHGTEYYPRFKAWCDTYFRIPHRNESRGIGGIFFDNFTQGGPEAAFALVQSCAAAFTDAYVPLVARRKDMAFTEAHKRWQQLRRGRYVEFNLVYDRGTAFGLRTGGRIESILMSLPLTARWEYDMHPEPGSEEARLTQVLTNPKEWI